MNEDQFWELIESAKSQSLGSEDRAEVLREMLEARSETEIIEFDRWLREMLDRSYSWDLWAAAYIINHGCSDDGFDYFRPWLVAQGREVFEKALRDPESLADVIDGHAAMEELLYVAPQVYQAKTGSELPREPRERRELTGQVWSDDENALRAKYPKLYARVNEPRREDGPGASPLGGVVRNLMMNLLVKGRGSPDAESLYRQALAEQIGGTPGSLAKVGALLKEAADQGHAAAQYALGLCLQAGRGVKQNFQEAEKRYRQAAEKGHAEACAALAKLYDAGLETDEDEAEAFKWYQRGAELGSRAAEFGLGLLYAKGRGVAENFSEAFKWFHRAAQSGHDAAALNVGLYYLNGKGIAADAAKAFEWFQRAAEAGNTRARFNLGVLYEKGQGTRKDFAKAIEAYEKAAQDGSDAAMVNLGMIYSNGRGAPKNYETAADWFQRAADAGNLSAVNNLAILFQHGRGVTKDEAEAFRLFRRSADGGNVVGLFNLGTLYHRGIGCEKNDAEAIKCYRAGAEKNHGPSLNNLADAYENGCGVRQSYAEAVKYYERAAERGVAASHYSLGKFYRDGLGVTQSDAEAAKWFQSAAELGYEKAATALEEMRAVGRAARPTEAPVPARTDNAPGSEENAEGKVVSPSAAAQRALCLRALLLRVEAEGKIFAARRASRDVEATSDQPRRINEWLKDQGLWLLVSRHEKKLLAAAPGSWSEHDLKQVCWRAEALGVIAWALGCAENIAPYDAQVEGAFTEYGLPVFSDAQAFCSAAQLRSESEIKQAREVAETWLWRARTTQIQKEPAKYPPPTGWTYEKIIAMAAEHWEKEGLFKAVKSDYPVLGKAYFELTEVEWITLRSIATERLYGLNWLCGHAADWDAVPTET